MLLAELGSAAGMAGVERREVRRHPQGKTGYESLGKGCSAPLLCEEMAPHNEAGVWGLFWMMGPSQQPLGLRAGPARAELASPPAALSLSLMLSSISFGETPGRSVLRDALVQFASCFSLVLEKHSPVRGGSRVWVAVGGAGGPSTTLGATTWQRGGGRETDGPLLGLGYKDKWSVLLQSGCAEQGCGFLGARYHG